MKNILRATLNWFGGSDELAATDFASAPIDAQVLLNLQPVMSEPIAVVIEPSTVNFFAGAQMSDHLAVITNAPPVESSEPTPSGVADSEVIDSVDADPVVSEIAPTASAVTEVGSIEVSPAEKIRGAELKITVRGARHYANCTACEATWSLRDRLFDPRTGRPAVIDELVCPMCAKPVSLPAGIDIKSIK